MEATIERPAPTLLVIDYGMGNLTSVTHALDELGLRWVIARRADELPGAAGLILPGVGAFGSAVENLTRSGLFGALERAVLEERTPVLGICLGMQMLVESSEEYGHHRGFGWIPGRVEQIRTAPGYRLPHVGWNELDENRAGPLFDTLPAAPHFFFDHSFAVQCEPGHVQATTQYGTTLTAAIGRDHIFGVQFHPEKSQVNGLRIIKQFARYTERHRRD